MARPTRASGERNPKAMRVSGCSPVFMLSTRGLGQSVGEGGLDADTALGDGHGQLHEGGDAATPAHFSQASSRAMPSALLRANTWRSWLFEQIDAVEHLVGLGDGGQLGLLAGASVVASRRHGGSTST